MLCAPCHPETPARKHISNITAVNCGNSDHTAFVFLFRYPTKNVHRINSCTGVDVTLQERSQGTTWLPCWLVVAILSLLILYDPPQSACQSYTALSARHKGHQQHPSLAQLLLEGLFIFFSWLLGHKEESQAKQPSLCWAHCISIPLQSTGSESSCGPGSTSHCLCLRNSLEHKFIMFLSAKHWGSRAELQHIQASALECSGYRRPKSKASKQQRGPERSLLSFLPAMTDKGQNITTALLDYLEVLESRSKGWTISRHSLSKWDLHLVYESGSSERAHSSRHEQALLFFWEIFLPDMCRTGIRSLQTCEIKSLESLLFFPDAAEHKRRDTLHSSRANISNVSLNSVPHQVLPHLLIEQFLV